jgi:hypothetical protein
MDGLSGTIRCVNTVQFEFGAMRDLPDKRSSIKGTRANLLGAPEMRLISLVLAMALTSSAALAGDAKPLAPGAAAGVKKAQLGIDNGLLIVLGVALVVGIAVAASSGDDVNTPAPPVTTS